MDRVEKSFVTGFFTLFLRHSQKRKSQVCCLLQGVVKKVIARVAQLLLRAVVMNRVRRVRLTVMRSLR